MIGSTEQQNVKVRETGGHDSWPFQECSVVVFKMFGISVVRVLERFTSFRQEEPLNPNFSLFAVLFAILSLPLLKIEKRDAHDPVSKIFIVLYFHRDKLTIKSLSFLRFSKRVFCLLQDNK